MTGSVEIGLVGITVSLIDRVGVGIALVGIVVGGIITWVGTGVEVGGITTDVGTDVGIEVGAVRISSPKAPSEFILTFGL